MSRHITGTIHACQPVPNCLLVRIMSLSAVDIYVNTHMLITYLFMFIHYESFMFTRATQMLTSQYALMIQCL